MTGEQVSVQTEKKSEVLQPKKTPEGTVRELYADDTFFQIRNALPPPMGQRFSRCFTPELVRYFQSHNEDVERWLEEHKNETSEAADERGPDFSFEL